MGDVGAGGCSFQGLHHIVLCSPTVTLVKEKSPLTPNSASSKGQSGCRGKSVRAAQAHRDLPFPRVPLQPLVIQLPKLSTASLVCEP